jgi:hypothetical protein
VRVTDYDLDLEADEVVADVRILLERGSSRAMEGFR